MKPHACCGDCGELDAIDETILAALSQNARMRITELSERPVLNHEKLDRGHIAFVQISLTDTKSRALAAFDAAVRRTAEVEQCHMIASSFDYLIKVRTRDISAFRQVLGERISALPHVLHTSTFVAMGVVLDQGA